MTYNYLVDGNGNLVRNRLYHVRDYAGVTSPTYNNPSGTMSSQMDANNSDLDDQGQFIDASIFEVENDNNYKYDEEGRLIQDLKEGIQEIVWRVDGKVKKVIFTSGSGKNNIEFDYDAFGRRIAKHVWTQGNILLKSTYYLLDASGNLMNVMEHTVTGENSSFTLKERNIYGASVLGLNKHEVDLLSTTSNTFVDGVLGEKFYNLSNHLGNVLTTISDIKVPESSDNVSVTSYSATIVNTFDYSPFGVMLDGRTQENEFVRSGFNGMERDDELKGMGNSYTTEFRQYDSRLARWLSVDPLWFYFDSESPYSAMSNSPIMFADPSGLGSEPKTYTSNNSNSSGNQSTQEEVNILRTSDKSEEIKFIYNRDGGGTVEVLYSYNQEKEKWMARRTEYNASGVNSGGYRWAVSDGSMAMVDKHGPSIPLGERTVANEQSQVVQNEVHKIPEGAAEAKQTETSNNAVNETINETARIVQNVSQGGGMLSTGIEASAKSTSKETYEQIRKVKKITKIPKKTKSTFINSATKSAQKYGKFGKYASYAGKALGITGAITEGYSMVNTWLDKDASLGKKLWGTAKFVGAVGSIFLKTNPVGVGVSLVITIGTAWIDSLW